MAARPPAPLRVWVDAQLPPALARWLATDYGADAAHVLDLGLLTAADALIFERARSARSIVVTRDVDFVQLLERRGPPPQVVWVTAGNLSNARLRELLRKHWARAAELLASGEALIEIGGP